jgi:hypothetical protein
MPNEENYVDRTYKVREKIAPGLHEGVTFTVLHQDDAGLIVGVPEERPVVKAEGISKEEMDTNHRIPVSALGKCDGVTDGE